MTTSPVVSITDELIAELEAAASDSKLNIYRPFGWAHSVRCGNHLQTDFDFLSLASPETVLALLAHIADLKQQLAAASVDAERWRYAKYDTSTGKSDICVIKKIWGDGCKYTQEIILTEAAADAARDIAAMDIGSGD